MNRTTSASALLAAVLLLRPGGLLAAASSCSDGFVDGQQLEKSGKLLGAREKYLACAVESCGKNLSKDCREHYEAVLPRIPTVTFEAWRGESQLTTFSVSVDGSVVKVEGTALEVDPGKHSFVFQVGAETVNEERLVVEGKKGQLVKAVFAKAMADASEVKEPKPASSPSTPQAPAADRGLSSRGLGGLIVGGFGVAAVGAGVVLGLSAKSLADSADCQGSVCATAAAADQRHTAVGRAGVATVVFSVGAAVAVGGLVLWLTAPSETSKKQVGLRVGPAGVGLDLRF